MSTLCGPHSSFPYPQLMRKQQPPSFIKYYKAYLQLKQAKDILERDHNFDRRIVSHLNDALAILFEQGNFEDGTLWDE